MKHFFDFDLNNCTQLFITLVVFSGLLKLLVSRIAEELHAGLLTVKEDLANLADTAKDIKDHWENSNTHRYLKDHLTRQ